METTIPHRLATHGMASAVRRAWGRTGDLRRRLFGIDLRTLACFRCALAAALLIDLIGRLPDAAMMYGEDGVMPQKLLHEVYYQGRWTFSLYYLSTSLWWQLTLLWLTIAGAVALAVGWRTRAVTVALWVLVVSLHNRGPLLVTGGDVLLSMLLLWSIFVPLGATWSLEARGKPRRERSATNVGTAMLLLQMAMMYFFTGVSKFNEVWLSGDALANIFHFGVVARPMGQWLAEAEWLLRFATWGTLALELAGPGLLFSPWATATLRKWTALSFAMLHVGIELTMRVVIFSFVSLAGLVNFTPSSFWESGWGSRVGRWLDRRFGHADGITDGAPNGHLDRGFPQVALALLAAVVISVNVPFLWHRGSFVQHATPWARTIGNALACFQRWDMFAMPAFGDYRLVAVGIRHDGSQIDILRDGRPVRLDDPSALPPSPRTPRWLGMYFDLIRADQRLFRREFARYLMTQWNRRRSPSEQVESVQLVLLVKPPRPMAGTNQRPATLVLEVYDPLVDGNYVDGERHGKFTVRHPNGRKSSEGEYRHGLPHGLWSYWDEQGRLQGRGRYEQGKMEGRWELYYEDGTYREAWFHDGRPIPPPLDRQAAPDASSDETDRRQECGATSSRARRLDYAALPCSSSTFSVVT